MKKGILLFLAITCIALTACVPTNHNVSKASSEKATNASGSSVPAASSEVPASSSEESATITMGTESAIAEWTINVESVQFLDKVKNGEYLSFSPDDGNKYLVATVTIANKAKEAQSFLSPVSLASDVSVTVLYGDGYEFSSTNLLGYEKDLHMASLNPLSSKNGEITFEVPDSVATATDELIVQFSAGRETLSFKAR